MRSCSWMARGVSSSFFRRASRSTELRVISPFFSISCKMPVTVERRMENWAWMSRWKISLPRFSYR